jgi:hypothetical protein
VQHDSESMIDAPRNWHEMASCEGKVGFLTYTAAKKVASRKNNLNVHRTAYRCRHCHMFHIGGEKFDNKKPLPYI